MLKTLFVFFTGISQKDAPSKNYSFVFSSILMAIPLSLLGTAILETLHVPLLFNSQFPFRLLRIPAVGLSISLTYLWGPIFFQLYVAVLALFQPSTLRGQIFKAVVIALLCSAIAYNSYHTLSQYSAFAGYPPFIAAFGLLAMVLFGWINSLSAPTVAPDSNGAATFLTQWSTTIFMFLGFIATHLLNYKMYANSYPTLHLAAFEVSYLILHAGLAGLLIQLRRRFSFSKTPWVITFIVLVQLVYVTIPVTTKNTNSKAFSTFLRYTALGQAAAPAFAPVASSSPKKVTILPDAKGRKTFKKYSNLPELTPGFNLRNYNVLWISMEATRFRDTSLANPRKGLTPNLYKLAKNDSFWFRRAYSPSIITIQSMSSTFSMVYPSSTHFKVTEKPWDGELMEGDVLVPTLFEKAGYSTFWVGHDLKLAGLERGFSETNRIHTPFEIPNSDIAIAREAIKTIDKHKKGRFFGWLFFVSPHHPYEAHYDDMPKATKHQRYLQDLRFGDEQIGKVLDHLKKTGLDQNTIVVFHGDHGEAFSEHGSNYHNSLYVETTHVPLIVHIPRVKGTIMEQTTSVLYVLPWLLEKAPHVLSTHANKTLQNVIGPMMNYTQGAVIVEKLSQQRMQTALITDNYRTIYDFPSRAQELFDTQKDPKELHDIFDGQSDISKRVAAQMTNYLEARSGLQRFTIDKDAPASPKK